MKKKNNQGVAVFIAVFVIIAAGAFYYLFNQNEMDRRGDIVGDRICGDFANKEAMDSCCKDVHSGDVHAMCEGGWEYLSGTRKCQFICTGSLPSCTEDFRVCESGDVVGRNPEQGCDFYSCP